MNLRARTPTARGEASALAAAALGMLAMMLAAPLGAGCSAGDLDVIDLGRASLTSHLLAHWSFDDGAGTVLADVSGNGHDGYILGATPAKGGQFGGALHFEPGGGAVVPFFPQPMGDWTVAGWVRPPAGDFGTGYLTILSTEILFMGGWELNATLSPPNSFYEFAYWIGPGQSVYVYHDCTCVTVNAWTHLAAVVDASAGTMSFYRNAVLESVVPAPKPIGVGTSTLYLGRWATDDNRDITGDLDDFAIYDRALVRGEIQLLMQAPAPSLP